MIKLQLRLDQAQTQDVIAALRIAIMSEEASDQTIRWSRLIAWLRWRHDKLWGPPAGNPERVSADEALSQLRAKLTGVGSADTVDHGSLP